MHGHFRLKLILLLFLFTACKKVNNNNNSNNNLPINNFTVTALIDGSKTKGSVLIDKDTPLIVLTIVGTIPSATYTLTANDTVYINDMLVPAGSNIIANGKSGMYDILYTSNVVNSMKVLSFTVKDNFGTTKNVNDTFNVRDNFMADLYPTTPAINIGMLDTIIVNIRAIESGGSYTFQLNNSVDTLYYQNRAIVNGGIVTLSKIDDAVTTAHGAFDTLTYTAFSVTPGNIGINYTIDNTVTSGMPQTGVVNINLVSNNFTATIQPKTDSFLINNNDTVTISIANIVNPNATYSLQIDSAFIYKGVSYSGGSRVILQNLKGKAGLDSIVFQGKFVGAFNPTLTIKNSLLDSNVTVQSRQLFLSVLSRPYYFLVGTGAAPGVSEYTISTDGSTWSTPQTFNASLSSAVNAVAFSTAFNVVAVTNNGSFMRSRDGGLTWSNPALIGANIANATLVKFSTATNGVVVGANGYYAYTRDSGSTWSTPVQISGFSPSDMAFSSATTGVIVGDYGLYSYTSDGGATWSAVKLGPVTNYISSVVFAPAKTSTGKFYGAMTFASSYIAYSLDSGRTWSSVEAPLSDDVSAAGYSSPTNLSFIATYLDNAYYLIFTSTDGGMSVSHGNGLQLGALSGPFRSLNFLSKTTAESSNNGLLLHPYSSQYAITSDGGASYSIATSPLSINTWLTVNKNIVWQ